MLFIAEQNIEIKMNKYEKNVFDIYIYEAV